MTMELNQNILISNSEAGAMEKSDQEEHKNHGTECL